LARKKALHFPERRGEAITLGGGNSVQKSNGGVYVRKGDFPGDTVGKILGEFGGPS